MKKNRILLVDDDPKLLKLYVEQLSDLYTIHTAENGDDGLLMISQDDPFMVVVSDYQMPDMDGIEFLTEVAKYSPDSIRIMLTGNKDLETVINAVNEGKIFRFLTKPCPPKLFFNAIEMGVRQYHLIQKERAFLENIKIREMLEKAKDRFKLLLEERTGELLESNKRLNQEIQERKLAEKELRDWQNILQLAMDNIHQCIFWKDVNSVYLGANKNFIKLVSLPDGSAIVGKTDDMLEWSEAESLKKYGELAIESDTPCFDVIEEFKKKEGRTIYWDMGSFPYHDEKGNVIGVLCTLVDISDQIISEEALIQNEKREIIINITQRLSKELEAPVQALSITENIMSQLPRHDILHSYVKTVSEQTAIIKDILLKLKSSSEN